MKWKWKKYFYSKGENRFYGDRLINGGVQKGLTNGIDYEEVNLIFLIILIHE